MKARSESLRESARDAKMREKEARRCRVCAWRICATHNLETRGEFAPPPPEIRHPDHADHDNEMPDQNDTAEDGEMLQDCASLHILESLRELAKKNMPNTNNIHPTPNDKEICSSLQLKDEFASHMQNLLVWAMPALILSEDEASTELPKEHDSRSAGLNQRLAEAERDELGSLIQRAKQQDDEERKKRELQPIGGQRARIPQENEQSNFQTKQRMPKNGETDHVGEQASNSRRRNDKDDPGLPRDDLPEEHGRK